MLWNALLLLLNSAEKFGSYKMKHLHEIPCLELRNNLQYNINWTEPHLQNCFFFFLARIDRSSTRFRRTIDSMVNIKIKYEDDSWLHATSHSLPPPPRPTLTLTNLDPKQLLFHEWMVSRHCFCRCCLIHDKCWDDIKDKNTCNSELLTIITYIRDGCSGCGTSYTFIYLV